MRRPAVLTFALATLACQPRAQTRAPEPDPAATLDSLIEQIAVIPDEPRPGVCERIDAELAGLGATAVGHKAEYARAELALRCDRPERWRAIHEALARADYMPSLVRLGNDAIARGDWDRAIAIVVRIAERSDRPGDRERMQALEPKLIHARWIERGAPEDFARLERAAKTAIVRDPKQLDARAALIRLYTEQAAITGSGEALILAQISEREARRIAADLGRESPALELVSGFVRELEGDRPAAIAAWTRALELNAALVEPRLWLGLAALERQDYALAQAQLGLFLDVHPEHVDALLAYGAAARRNGDIEAADWAYARAVELAPDDPRAHWNRALAHHPDADPNPDAWVYEADVGRYAEHLRSFTLACELAEPRTCAGRGDAGPDPACVREAERLERRYDDALAELTTLDEAVIGCSMGELEHERERLLELEREQELERRTKLLELERRAREAAGE